MSLLSVDGIIMFPKISELVKVAKEEDAHGDKCIFGVYTKWDEFIEKKSKGNVPVDVKYLRGHHNEKYLKKIYEKNAGEDEEEEVFFVDVGCGESFDVSILIRICPKTVII